MAVESRLLLSQRIVTPEGILAGGVAIEGGLIAGVFDVLDADIIEAYAGVTVDYGDQFILPGVIDGHVHVNQPGRTEWEGIETATRAAAAGGITTIVDMPLNSSPVTITLDALEQKRQSIAGKCWVDVGLHGGAVGRSTDLSESSYEDNMESLIAAGIMGLKVFLCDSGLDEFPPVTRRELHRIMPILARHRLPLWVHAELVPDEWIAPSSIERYAEWPIARSRAFEINAIRELIELCGEYSCPTHIVHLSNADALSIIRRAKRRPLSLTVETCPHYLHFCSERIPDRDPRFKCSPPIREIENQHRLWQALELGEIDTIGSDHSPCPPAMKFLETGDFAKAWGGIASLQLLLPVMWTKAMAYQFSITRLVECLSSSPAKLLGLQAIKGSIERGKQADLVVFDPEKKWIVCGNDLFHRHKVTPYEGNELCGQVIATYLGGNLIFDSEVVAELPRGQLLTRRSATGETTT